MVFCQDPICAAQNPRRDFTAAGLAQHAYGKHGGPKPEVGQFPTGPRQDTQPGRPGPGRRGGRGGNRGGNGGQGRGNAAAGPSNQVVNPPRPQQQAQRPSAGMATSYVPMQSVNQRLLNASTAEVHDITRSFEWLVPAQQDSRGKEINGVAHAEALREVFATVVFLGLVFEVEEITMRGSTDWEVCLSTFDEQQGDVYAVDPQNLTDAEMLQVKSMASVNGVELSGPRKGVLIALPRHGAKMYCTIRSNVQSTLTAATANTIRVKGSYVFQVAGVRLKMPKSKSTGKQASTSAAP